MQNRMRRLIAGIVMMLVGSAGLDAAPSVVTVLTDASGRFSLSCDGRPYEIRGVAGTSHLELARKLGATTIRTWGTEDLSEKVDGVDLLDRCEALNLTVMAGLWVEHPGRDFDYTDQGKLMIQRENIRSAVRQYKDRHALLFWGLGNDMGLSLAGDKDTRAWVELNTLAQIIHEEDPNHPVVTVIASADPVTLKKIKTIYANLDILGINAYGAAPNLCKVLKASDWTKPFLVTEFGPIGGWEAQTTRWHAPIEQSDWDKAMCYHTTQTALSEEGKGYCLGAFAFKWGHKHEVTSTWYGMFLSTGEKLTSVDFMSYAWTGHWPANRSPRILKLEAPFKLKEIAPDVAAMVTVEARDHENDTLSYEWQIVGESTGRQTKDGMPVLPPIYNECIIKADGPVLQMRTPARRGAYRVFCIVRDGKGGASVENFPFLVMESPPP